MADDLKNLIKDWLETATNYRKLAELNFEGQAEKKGYKHSANMLEACADELETLIKDKESES